MRHLLTDSSKTEIMYYDSQFYEYSALCDIAKKYDEQLYINYRFPDYYIPISKRYEFDGYFEKQNIAVEVKSYPLTDNETHGIEDKYTIFDIDKLVIVSPKFVNVQKRKTSELIEFVPSLNNFSKEKYANLSINLSQFIQAELNTGKHNFRFRLAKRAKNKRSRYLNQTDKMIKCIRDIKSEILLRTPNNNPPIKVLWSTKQWVSPKDHFYKKRDNLCLGGPIVFDIDGPMIHGAFKPCAIDSENNICQMCKFFALKENEKLVNILDWAGFRNIVTFFSGRSGYHTYVFDDNEDKLKKASMKFMEKKIKIDKQVTYSVKAEVAFPLTINGFTGNQLTQIL